MKYENEIQNTAIENHQETKHMQKYFYLVLSKLNPLCAC